MRLEKLDAVAGWSRREELVSPTTGCFRLPLQQRLNSPGPQRVQARPALAQGQLRVEHWLAEGQRQHGTSRAGFVLLFFGFAVAPASEGVVSDGGRERFGDFLFDPLWLTERRPLLKENEEAAPSSRDLLRSSWDLLVVVVVNLSGSDVDTPACAGGAGLATDSSSRKNTSPVWLHLPTKGRSMDFSLGMVETMQSGKSVARR